MFNVFETQQKKHISILQNGDPSISKDMYLEADWSFEDFLRAAGQRLNMCNGAAKRAFHCNGEDIDDCMMIEDDDILIISDGQPFNPVNEDEDGQVKAVGPYKVGELLGSGGFSEVHAGTNTISNQKVALKFVHKSGIQNVVEAERAASEYRVLSSLNHRNVIKLHSHFETSKHVILAFDFMEGGDLHKYLLSRGHTAAESALPEEEARGVFVQIMDGLNYAHAKNIVHRDLKLENILLTKPGSLAEVKIADFGLAEFCGPNSAVSKTAAGTLSFMPPEAIEGKATDGTKIDVWAMGIILFALLCGRLPFDGSDLTYEDRPSDAIVESRIKKGAYEIDKHLSDGAKDIIIKMLSQHVTDRASIPEVLGHNWIRDIPMALSEAVRAEYASQLGERTNASLPGINNGSRRRSKPSEDALNVVVDGAMGVYGGINRSVSPDIVGDALDRESDDDSSVSDSDRGSVQSRSRSPSLLPAIAVPLRKLSVRPRDSSFGQAGDELSSSRHSVRLGDSSHGRKSSLAHSQHQNDELDKSLSSSRSSRRGSTSVMSMSGRSSGGGSVSGASDIFAKTAQAGKSSRSRSGSVIGAAASAAVISAASAGGGGSGSGTGGGGGGLLSGLSKSIHEFRLPGSGTADPAPSRTGRRGSELDGNAVRISGNVSGDPNRRRSEPVVMESTSLRLPARKFSSQLHDSLSHSLHETLQRTPAEALNENDHDDDDDDDDSDDEEENDGKKEGRSRSSSKLSKAGAAVSSLNGNGAGKLGLKGNKSSGDLPSLLAMVDSGAATQSSRVGARKSSLLDATRSSIQKLPNFYPKT